MSYWTFTSDFFSQRYGHIKFWHLYEQPYAHSHLLFGAYHFAFENLSWKFVLAGFDDLWIRIYNQKIDISISKMADSKWRIEIYEIKRFRSLMLCYLSKLISDLVFTFSWRRKVNSKPWLYNFNLINLEFTLYISTLTQISIIYINPTLLYIPVI